MVQALADQLNITFAPYGCDPITLQPYPPHPSQLKTRQWALAVRNGTLKTKGIPVLYIQHGVNSGSTRGALTPLIEYIFEQPGINALIARKDFVDLRKSGMDSFFQMVDETLILKRNEQIHEYLIRSKGGVSTVFFSDLKDVDGLGSQQFAVIVVVEAHEIRDVNDFIKLRNRARQGQLPSMVILEGNAPIPGHWLDRVTDPKSPIFDPDITVLKVSSHENWNFMTEQYRNTLDSMAPSLKRRYVLGEMAALPSGTPVYPSFVQAIHVRDTFFIHNRPIIRFWDFGLRRAACLWAQTDDSGRLFVHREWMAIETPEEQFMDGVIIRTNEWFGDVICRDFGDPAARNRDPNGVSALMRLQKRGINLGYRQTTYGERIPLINRKLSEIVSKLPAVTINPTCQILEEGLAGGYHYPELREGQAFNSQKDIPFKDGWFEHIANAFEYGMVNIYGSGNQLSQQLAHKKRMRNREYAKTQGVAVF